MKVRRILPALALGLSLSTVLDAHAVAQNRLSSATIVAGTAEPGSNLTVYLLTFGWGNAVWERFGHNAIRINDLGRGTDVTYNWGMFDFDQPHFLRRFLTGDTRNWMEEIDLEPMLRYYKQHNRTTLAQELNLSPSQRLKHQQFVQW